MRLKDAISVDINLINVMIWIDDDMKSNTSLKVSVIFEGKLINQDDGLAAKN